MMMMMMMMICSERELTFTL